MTNVLRGSSQHARCDSVVVWNFIRVKLYPYDGFYFARAGEFGWLLAGFTSGIKVDPVLLGWNVDSR